MCYILENTLILPTRKQFYLIEIGASTPVLVLDQMQFIVALCYDVLLEVLKHGKRRQLAMLEAVGRRFQRIIDAKFIESPYLLLDLEFR